MGPNEKLYFSMGCWGPRVAFVGNRTLHQDDK